MSDFCTITCDRGDRPMFLNHCKYQLSRMTIKPAKSYFIDHAPKGPEKDLIERMKIGISLAIQDGFDKVYVIESDDYYPADYFERMKFDGDFVGDDRTTYYHVKNQGYQSEFHPRRASLFTTGFKISSLDGFDFNMTGIFLDIKLWEFARQKNLRCKFVDSGAIGIKHSIGLTAGIGHKQKIYNRFDRGWIWLKSKVGENSLNFYKSLENV